jgi:hypothetical protein
VAPKVSECSAQLQIGADGNAGPITCPNGDLNALGWDYFEKSTPLIMSLGPDVTLAEVQEALCADLHNSTIPIETSAYNMAALYYGWRFGIDPAGTLVSGGCQS